jgi:protein-arginine kinase activator protein McsA
MLNKQDANLIELQHVTCPNCHTSHLVAPVKGGYWCTNCYTRWANGISPLTQEEQSAFDHQTEQEVFEFLHLGNKCQCDACLDRRNKKYHAYKQWELVAQSVREVLLQHGGQMQGKRKKDVISTHECTPECGEMYNFTGFFDDSPDGNHHVDFREDKEK